MKALGTFQAQPQARPALLMLVAIEPCPTRPAMSCTTPPVTTTARCVGVLLESFMPAALPASLIAYRMLSLSAPIWKSGEELLSQVTPTSDVGMKITPATPP